MKHLGAIGFGYTARALAHLLDPAAWSVTGSSRSPGGAASIGENRNWTGFVCNDQTSPDALAAALQRASHILISAGPALSGDPVIGRLDKAAGGLPLLRHVSYLSTVGVYGDHGGGWVTEATVPQPTSERGGRRVAAEAAWLAFGQRHGVQVQVFRLPGIYGPGRSAFDKLADGTARRVNKPGQVFNRMHVEDIAGALALAMDNMNPSFSVCNLADDLPAPPQDVIAFAAGLMGIEAPPETRFELAEMTPMARSFYRENKRVSNRRMREQLGYTPAYQTYREGLRAIWDAQPK